MKINNFLDKYLSCYTPQSKEEFFRILERICGKRALANIRTDSELDKLVTGIVANLFVSQEPFDELVAFRAAIWHHAEFKTYWVTGVLTRE